MVIADASQGENVAIAVKNSLPPQLTLVKLSHQLFHQVCHQLSHQVCHQLSHQVCHQLSHQVCHQPYHQVCHQPYHQVCRQLSYQPFQVPHQGQVRASHQLRHVIKVLHNSLINSISLACVESCAPGWDLYNHYCYMVIKFHLGKSLFLLECKILGNIRWI